MKILITGSNGFIGKNLCLYLKNLGYTDLLECSRDTSPDLLDFYTADCEFVFHLAGVNRPADPSQYAENYIFTSVLLENLEKHQNKATVLMSSSTQAERDNPYGRSKKRAEEILLAYHEKTGADVLIYRLPGVFGKWCRPNYNNVVATFCDFIAKGQPVTVDDAAACITLTHIDDVVEEFIRALHGQPNRQGRFCALENTYDMTVGALRDTLVSFRLTRNNLLIPELDNRFVSKLYSTYISYLQTADFDYPLKVHADQRGSFTEFLKSEGSGQVSVNISKPGVIKGNHWHHTKTEKFLAVSGMGLLLFRKLGTEDILMYPVSGDNPVVVDVPPGYVHTVMNTGAVDLVMVIWSNQIYDPQNPDTFPAEISD